MDIHEIDTQIRKVFADLFPVDTSEITDESRRGELEGWDSLGHLDLVGALESRFSLSIEPDEALEIETFGDAKRVIARLTADG